MKQLAPLMEVIHASRRMSTRSLIKHTSEDNATRDIYHRYLSLQYHLTRGVQRYFIKAAAHEDLARMRKLRRFLVDFANEEEHHYLVAARDLLELGLEVHPQPLDVEFWHAEPAPSVERRPFVRLGAAAVLENLAGIETRPMISGQLTPGFLPPASTRLFMLHPHKLLPHGAQILDALGTEDLANRHVADLLEGAVKGAAFYLRMIEWSMNPQARGRMAGQAPGSAPTVAEHPRIEQLMPRTWDEGLLLR